MDSSTILKGVVGLVIFAYLIILVYVMKGDED